MNRGARKRQFGQAIIFVFYMYFRNDCASGQATPGLSPFTNESVPQELVSLYLADLDCARAARLGQAGLG